MGVAFVYLLRSGCDTMVGMTTMWLRCGCGIMCLLRCGCVINVFVCMGVSLMCLYVWVCH